MQQAESILSIHGAETTMRVQTTRVSRRDRGAMLLAVLFMMAMMVLTALAVAPAFIQQAKRDQEEEMVHRGTEYARAIKKYYKRFGRYPANLEQLDETNQMRFLRKRFKDPLAKDGKWKLLRVGDIQGLLGPGVFGVPALQPGLQQGAPGVPLGSAGGLQGSNPQYPAAGSTGGDQGASTAPAGAQLSAQQQAEFLAGQAANQAAAEAAQQAGGASPFAAGGSGAAAGQSGPGTGIAAGQGSNADAGQGSNQGASGQTGSNNTIFGNTGVGGQTFGGGAIVGVASKSKNDTIRIYNKKKKYDEWQFIYSPMLDRQNTLLRGPYNGQTLVVSQVGTPAGQLNQTNKTGSGQQPGGLGQQQPGGFGQQNPQQNQQMTPPNQFPPDQTQPQQ